MGRFEFRLPDVGEGLAEAEVIHWLVNVGDRVAQDQVVVELQTDKAMIEMPSPVAGVVLELGAPPGNMVKVGSVLYVIDGDSEEAGAGPAPAAASPAGAGLRASRPHDGAGPAEPASPLRPEPVRPVQAAPAVRRLARELGVDLAGVAGSGPGGRITADDVRGVAGVSREGAASERVVPAGPLPPAAPHPHPSPPPPAPARYTDSVATDGGLEERMPLRGVPRRMAEAMAVSARTIPQVTGFHEMDATGLVDVFDKLRRRAADRGLTLRVDALLIKIAAAALLRHPLFNASLDEERMEIVLKKRVNVGVAVATPQGLIVPVVRDADRLGIWELMREVERLIEAARSSRVELPDLSGGTFTITNSGGWSGWFGTSLIRHPEVAIMGVGKIQDRAVVRDGNVVVRPILPVAITFDHRLIDGEAGMKFAATVREYVETPGLAFFES